MKPLFLILFFVAFFASGCTPPAQGSDLYKTLAFVIIALIIILFFALAIYSNILRDEVNDCHSFDKKVHQRGKRGRVLADPRYPFSLSKVQLAVWTVIISCSFIYLALCKGDCTDAPINQTALILMGIGVGVTASAAIIDKKEIGDNRVRHQNAPSEGFFVDILSDNNGISIHRFQNVVWTVIAMVIYINKVCTIEAGCLLPELSQTLLILTGISSATYVALKAGENSPPDGSTQADDDTVTAGVTASPAGGPVVVVAPLTAVTPAETAGTPPTDPPYTPPAEPVGGQPV
ncbi:hypothetical protein [Hufsiella ginkgonis]|uniref:Uncharacterized protein n=1 Tax=Hufsiella ginkgonis TaxID=2695274 RepID=A0A7K1XT43_9SPHI|nr:hypothetical protein [Hufsiella ginkgonis]MXV14090.1 hypothetical protein [Hufsiella ginkgonis]